MWNRIILAFVGGSIITVGIFLGMSQIAELFSRRDPTKYFQIDFIPPPSGRRLPNLPLPQSQPSRANVDVLRTDEAEIEAAPSFAPEEPARLGPRLRLEDTDN